MNKLIATFLMTLVLAAQTGSALFEKALVKERAEGDFPGAIKLYQEILRKHASDRPLIAKTLVQMAQCYEKQGSGEARKLYDRVIREFGDQRMMADMARERLAALGQVKTATVGMSVRQVWNPAIDDWGSVSADGRWLSFVDWSTGDLAIRDLTTGENRRLMNHGSWEEREVEAEGNKISPDGRQIVYMWNSWKKKGGGYELRLINSDGTGDRLLYRLENGGYVEPYDWSPVGKWIVAEVLPTGKLGTYQLALISVPGGAARPLITFQARRPYRAFFSPDGNWLVYSVPTDTHSRLNDVFLLDLRNPVEGRLEIPLVSNPADDRVMGWSPDGSLILFRSSRGGSIGAWLLPVGDGQAAGEAKLVKGDMGDWGPLGFTRNGSYLYSLKQGGSDVVTGVLDPATTKLALVTGQLEGNTIGGLWSPDGTKLLFRSTQRPELRIRDVASGAERVVRPQLAGIGGGAWHPDSNSMLIEGISMDKKDAGIFRVDSATGEAVLLMSRAPGWVIGRFAMSPDAKTLYYKPNHFAITARVLATGEEKIVYQGKEGGGAIFHFAVSPDGMSIAVLHSTRSIMIFPSAGGPARERFVLPEKSQDRLQSLDWSPDGKQLFVSVKSGNPARFLLWRLPAQDGEPVVSALDSDLRFLTVHPDGKRIAGSVTRNWTEVWALENFLPQVQAAR